MTEVEGLNRKMTRDIDKKIIVTSVCTYLCIEIYSFLQKNVLSAVKRFVCIVHLTPFMVLFFIWFLCRTWDNFCTTCYYSSFLLTVYWFTQFGKRFCWLLSLLFIWRFQTIFPSSVCVFYCYYCLFVLYMFAIAHCFIRSFVNPSVHPSINSFIHSWIP